MEFKRNEIIRKLEEMFPDADSITSDLLNIFEVKYPKYTIELWFEAVSYRYRCCVLELTSSFIGDMGMTEEAIRRMCAAKDKMELIDRVFNGAKINT